MATDLASDKFWVTKNLYHDAEKKYHENLAKLLNKGQRRLELGENSDLANNKKLKEGKLLMQKSFADALKKELYKSEAQRNFNENSKSDTPNCVTTIIHKEKEKERTKKKSKSSKKSEKIKEKNDFLGGVGMAKLNQDTFPKTTLAGEVARARQHIKTSLECMENLRENGVDNMINPRLNAILEKMEKSIENLTERVKALEMKAASGNPPVASSSDNTKIFLEGENETADKVREQRLAERIAAKKSKKPALVAKSNIILDIKPWDDETDMTKMEEAVRAIEMDGLVWGASKLVPVAFKIFKLQITCVIEDDKVSVDLLTETLEGIEDYVQSVDIAAFNKV